MLSWETENSYYKKGYSVICGTDEAGRGPLAGDVYAAAVILPRGMNIEGLNDSKKISEKKREALFDIICKYAVAYSIKTATVAEIDELNILAASQLAMKRAVCDLCETPNLVLVDGNIARDFPCDAVTVIGGDAKSPNIAAASILAKVARDRYCAEMHEMYPEYNFAKHKGYPTKEHRELVKKLGPCPLHRKTFLKFLNK